MIRKTHKTNQKNMKMETAIIAPRDGTITELAVKAGQTVDAKELLLTVLIAVVIVVVVAVILALLAGAGVGFLIAWIAS